jgi:hypothetical protein
MRISYRQGLISAQSNFLQTNPVGSNVYVDIVVSPTPVIASIAFRDRDYLIDETVSVPNAWGPFTDTQTYYLFWEILPDGNLSRGSTVFSPVSSTNPPTEQIGQMWWDNSVKVMKVFDGFNWVPTLRVLAGSLHGGNVIPSSYGSQVGMNAPTDAGYILRDAFQNVFRDNNGNFLTSTSPLTSSDTGSLVKFDGTQLTAQANEPIPKFSLVYLRDGRAALASGIPPDNIPKAPLGMVTEDSPQDAAVTIVTAGKTVFNEQWDFAISDLGHAVFCGPNGEVAINKPLAQKNMRVGTIITKQSILLNFDWETEASTVTSGVTGVMASAPLSITGTLSTPMVNIQRADSNHDGFINASDFARIPTLELLVAGKADLVHSHSIANVTGLQGALDGKSNISHTQNIASIIDLQTALDDKAPLIHTHNLVDILGWPNAKLELDTTIASKIPKVLVGAGNFPMIVAGGTLTDSGFSDASFALASHTHVIVDVTDLPAALLLKSDVEHVHAIADVTGLVDELAGKALVVHSHVISNIAGLQSALDNKSNVGHTHLFADIPGLQPALDGKAATIHVHAISDVAGLQTALDDKAALSHFHAIGDTTGLQLALNSKADANHTHIAANITDFYATVTSTLVAGTNITLTPNAIAKTITVNASGGGGGSTIDLPNMRIPFGNTSGTYLSSSDEFTYEREGRVFTISSTSWTNGIAYPNTVFKVDHYGDLHFKEFDPTPIAAGNTPDWSQHTYLNRNDTVSFIGGNGYSTPDIIDGNSYPGSFKSNGIGFTIKAGKPDIAAPIKAGGSILLQSGSNFDTRSGPSVLEIEGSGNINGYNDSGSIYLRSGAISFDNVFNPIDAGLQADRQSGNVNISTGQINGAMWSNTLNGTEGAYVYCGDIVIAAGTSDDGHLTKNGRVILGAGNTDGLTIGTSGELELVYQGTDPNGPWTTAGNAGDVITSRGPGFTAEWLPAPQPPSPDVFIMAQYDQRFDTLTNNISTGRPYTPPVKLAEFHGMGSDLLDSFGNPVRDANRNFVSFEIPVFEFLQQGLYKISIQSEYIIPRFNDDFATQPLFPDNCQIAYGTIISSPTGTVAGQASGTFISGQTILESVHYRYGPTTVAVGTRARARISWHDEFIVMADAGYFQIMNYIDTNGMANIYYDTILDGNGDALSQRPAFPIVLNSNSTIVIEKLPGTPLA